MEEILFFDKPLNITEQEKKTMKNTLTHTLEHFIWK